VGAWILADEVYRGAEFEGPITPSLWGNYERTLCTGGFSKAFGMPGLRTGWVVGPPEMVEQLWGHHDYTSIGPTMLTDRLAVLALEPKRREWILGRTRQILNQNFPLVRAWLTAHGGLFSHIPPRAGAIAWAGLRDGSNSAQMAEELRSQKGVLIVPGEQFGIESHVRLGFGGNSEHLQQALARVAEWLEDKLLQAR
jgi:aspartate/methionine/tyrosine aminotransferase